MTPCLFVPPHEPFYCRIHADVRLRLTDEHCRRATPAPLDVLDAAKAVLDAYTDPRDGEFAVSGSGSYGKRQFDALTALRAAMKGKGAP